MALPVKVHIPEHDLEAVDWDGNTVIEWWCMQPGCDYEISHKTVVIGEVIEVAKPSEMREDRQGSVSPTESSNSRTSECQKTGNESPKNLSMSILQRLASN
jgi:hypothetical protein